MDESSAKHPIAVVAERTSLSPDTLRMWERRYRAVEPARGQGGHRAYSDADISRLRLLHAATAAGRAIGQVAHLSTADLARLVAEDAAARTERPRAGATSVSKDADALRDRAFALTAALDGVELEHLLRRAIARLGLATFVDELASPLMRRIGDDWHAGRSTIAHEHLASSTINQLLVESMRAMTPGTGAPLVLVSTPAGERHVGGAALAGATAASEGWRVVFLGPDLPAAEIASAAGVTRARVVALSVIYVIDRERTLGELRSLRGLTPPSVIVVVGGGGIQGIEQPLAEMGVVAASSLREFRQVLTDLTRGASDRGAA